MATHQYKLYLSKECPYCQRAMIAAAENRIEYEAVEITLGGMPDWYKQLNPAETVPLLQVDGEKLIFESDLISMYFQDIGDNKLMGSNALQRHQIEFFMSQVGDLTGASYGLFRNPLNAEKRKAVQDNAAYIDGIVAEMQTTGPYLCDELFSMAEVMLVPFLIRLKPALRYVSGLDIFANAPRLKRMYAAAVKRPSVAETSLSANAYIQFYLRRFVPDSAPMKAAKGGYVLYGNSMCPFVDRARLACELKNFHPFWVEIDLPDQPAWYKMINFLETVPVLMTPEGDLIRESQLIVRHVDAVTSSENSLVPANDPLAAYTARFVSARAGDLYFATNDFVANPDSQEAKDEMLWAAKAIDKCLSEKGRPGPFLGGEVMNEGDVTLLPTLVRIKAYMPELSNGYDLFAEFPQLGHHYAAGIATAAGAKVFADLAAYRNGKAAKLGRTV